MFTVCPKCALTLVVTAADLRVAQGYVRCGRCSSVFNALAQLTDERPPHGIASEEEETSGAAEELSREADTLSSTGSFSSDVVEEEFSSDSEELPFQGEQLPDAPEERFAEAPPRASEVAPGSPQSFLSWASHPTPVEPSASPADTGDEDAVPEDALEFDPSTTDVMKVFVAPPPNPEWAAATGSFRAMVGAKPAPEQKGATTPLDSKVDSPAATAVDERTAPAPPSLLRRTEDRDRGAPAPKISDGRTAPPPDVSPPAADRDDDRAKATDARPAPTAPGVAQPAVDLVHGTPQSADGHTAAAAAPTEEHAAKERELGPLLTHLQPYLWHATAALAVLVLLVQVVHHNRDELAAIARFNRPLSGLYAALGMPLVPRWDLHAYDVRQLGASVDPAAGGLMTVRASIRNSAQQAQPLPLLRVTLEDRFGNRIASRDVAPRSYLPQHGTPASLYIAGGQRVDAEMGFADPGANAVGFEIDACLPARGGGITCANDLGAH